MLQPRWLCQAELAFVRTNYFRCSFADQRDQSRLVACGHRPTVTAYFVTIERPHALVAYFQRCNEQPRAPIAPRRSQTEVGGT
jgi:hypothetical protein